MAYVVFYEKPGCINNTKQKKLLIQSGHEVDSRNLLTEHWDTIALRKYFGSLAIPEWFNQSAPDIKNGCIKPDNLSETEALELMVEIPLLIRRPLIKVDHEYCAGFDHDAVNKWIGLNVTSMADLENCSQKTGHRCETLTDKR